MKRLITGPGFDTHGQIFTDLAICQGPSGPANGRDSFIPLALYRRLQETANH